MIDSVTVQAILAAVPIDSATLQAILAAVPKEYMGAGALTAVLVAAMGRWVLQPVLAQIKPPKNAANGHSDTLHQKLDRMDGKLDRMDVRLDGFEGRVSRLESDVLPAERKE